MLDITMHDKRKRTTRDFLMNETNNRRKITHGVEQGYRNNEASIFTLFVPRNRIDVH